MKYLKLISTDVEPTYPEANSVYIVNGDVIYYNSNCEKINTSEVKIENFSEITPTGLSIIKSSSSSEVLSIIGASNLTLGTTATTAKAGNYKPTTAEVVAALKTMTTAQITEIKTLLNIT